MWPQIPYRTVEVSPLTKSELKWGPFRKVPVAVLDGEPLADSSAIVSRLAAEAGPRPPVQGGAAAPAAGGWASWRRKGQACLRCRVRVKRVWDYEPFTSTYLLGTLAAQGPGTPALQD